MRIGIVICERYGTCSGGKCFRAVNNREGAFQRYLAEETLVVVGYTTCGGCPGGNVEQVVGDLKQYGAEAIHFATGVLAGYPPCKYLATLKKLAEEKTALPVIIGTHPMPTNYIEMHETLDDWNEQHKSWLEEFDLMDEQEVRKYDSSLSDYNTILQDELARK